MVAPISCPSVLTCVLCRVGMKQICQPKAGETVVVSGGAGAVGSIAGQLAKAAGARVIGIAGSDAKVRRLTQTPLLRGDSCSVRSTVQLSCLVFNVASCAHHGHRLPTGQVHDGGVRI